MTSYTGHGQYKINYLKLVAPSAELDLSIAYVQIDLYESIFSPVITGSVIIMDTYNLQDVTPLYGDEKILLSFNTTGNDQNPIDIVGSVYKITEKHQISEHTSGYAIHFVSNEALVSARNVVQKTYKATCSAIVEDVYKTILGGSKPLKSTPTVGIDDWVFGAVHPFEVISIMSKYSYNNNHRGYLFYEDTKQFNFVPLQELYTQPAIIDYAYGGRGAYKDVKQAVPESNNTIQSFKLMEENSLMDRVMEGQHGSTTFEVNLLKKKVKDYIYNKESEFEPSKSLGDLAVKRSIPMSPNASMSIGYNLDPKFNLPDLVKSDALKVEVDTIRAEMAVFGDSFVRVGMTCDVRVPNWNMDQGAVKTMIDGKFLIASIHHVLNNTNYVQSMMIQKDGYVAL